MKNTKSMSKRYYISTGKYQDRDDRDEGDHPVKTNANSPREDGKRGKGRWGKELKEDKNDSLTGY